MLVHRPRSIFQHKSTREISNRINSAGYTNHTGVVSDVQNGAGVNSPNTKNQPQKTTVAASPVVDKVLHTVKPKEEKGSTGVVALDKVQPNPDQPRTNFKPEEIEELANSIKKEGLLQPILVRKVGENYQIIAGERRWQACKSLNMKEIPVRFWAADNDKALELALIENIQRTDLNPIEEAYGYKRLMERRGMTQSEVAQTVSKGRSTIANALRLLDLPEEAQQLLFEEKITAGHARAILSIPDAEGRKTLTQKLMDEKLSVRETEAIARLLSGRAQAKETGKNKRVPAPASFKKAARGLTRFLSVPVRVKTVQGKNKIEIQFKDEAELERILSLIAENSKSKGAEKAEA
jgi:ParB family chromosome partitioning protein